MLVIRSEIRKKLSLVYKIWRCGVPNKYMYVSFFSVLCMYVCMYV